jgi:hypothetical protein
MPLAFQSLNQGTVTFGFFNIDTDMLLLNSYFMFADTFCGLVTMLARQDGTVEFRADLDAFVIEKPEQIGDLMGAIQGVRHEGFIGAVYRRFRFPQRPEEFKQRAEGERNREIVRNLIEGYAVKTELPLIFVCEELHVGLGEYRFDRSGFAKLVKYVCDGGMPGWKDDDRPPYVETMISAIRESRNPLFGQRDIL